MIHSPYTGILIPVGSSNDSIIGTSHLFEHLLLSNFNNSGQFGFTTEDYIAIIVKHCEYLYLLDLIRKMRISNKEIRKEKNKIMLEIEEKRKSISEIFFKIIWADTIYQNSPLGCAHSINAIQRLDLIKKKEQILKLPIYTNNKQKEIAYNIKESVARGALFTVLFKRSLSINKREYGVIYFLNDLDYLILATEILKIANPNKHIQISIKKKLCAIIIQWGSVFPEYRNMNAFMTKAIQKMNIEINKMNENVFKRILFSLESFYYYELA
ncbi:MAG: insulinase family protein [Clostridiales bacterium]|nr:insulinase family protein [Clostridiales bacterium]